MANQETVNPARKWVGNGSAATRVSSGAPPADSERPRGAENTDTGAAAVVTNVASFGENLLTLTELQARLTAVELGRNIDCIRRAGTVFAAGAVLAVAALPVLLVGSAELLVTELGVKRGFALVYVSTVAIVLGGCLATFAVRRLNQSRLGLPLAAEELNRNINWLRTILRQSGRWPRR